MPVQNLEEAVNSLSNAYIEIDKVLDGYDDTDITTLPPKEQDLANSLQNYRSQISSMIGDLTVKSAVLKSNDDTQG